MRSMTTWGSWDVRCLNAVMKIPELAEVRLVIYDSRSKQMQEELRWDALERLGERSVNGDYSRIVLRAGEQRFLLEFASRGDCFVYKVVPFERRETQRVYIAGMLRWNAPGCVERVGEVLEFRVPGGVYRVTCSAGLDLTPVNVNHPGLLADGREEFFVFCNFAGRKEDAEAFLAERRLAWEAEKLETSGWLGEAGEAMQRGILWNTIYDPTRRRMITPVTREWCIIKPERPWFGSYVLFTWDTSFGGLIAGAQDEALAYRQIESLIEEMRHGMIPCTSSEVCTFDDRAQLPVVTYCALKLFRQFGDLEFLQRIYPRLREHHRWFLKYRDGNGDGLFEWGTNLEVTHTDYAGYLNEAKAESGLDNSPMYDETVFNPDTHTMELVDVGLSCGVALDAWSLAEVAALLGLEEDARELRAEFDEIAARINAILWNEELGIYCNRHWDGRFSSILSPTCFYPMLAGIAPRERAERMVREHLLNEEEFWGEFVIPSVTKRSLAFQDNDYWRGRIWAPTNFLVYEGLKRSGFDEIAHLLARKSLDLFLREWREENHIHENYNALTGEGDDVVNADPVYTWGGLLAYMALNELIYIRSEGGWDLGSVVGEPGLVQRVRVNGGWLSVEQNQGLRVLYRDRLILESHEPARVLGFNLKNGRMEFTLEAKGEGSLWVCPPEGFTAAVRLSESACRWKVIAPGQM